MHAYSQPITPPPNTSSERGWESRARIESLSKITSSSVMRAMVRVKRKLEEFFCGEPVELHHRPALCNRETHPVVGYVPHANDPDYLVYLPASDHDIETRVRGQHGAHSDLALARKRKRAERKKTKRKHEWPKRKMRAL